MWVSTNVPTTKGSMKNSPYQRSVIGPRWAMMGSTFQKIAARNGSMRCRNEIEASKVLSRSAWRPGSEETLVRALMAA